jgi:hypothetical protein
MDDPHFDHKSAKRFDRQRASGPFGVDELLPKKILAWVNRKHPDTGKRQTLLNFVEWQRGQAARILQDFELHVYEWALTAVKHRESLDKQDKRDVAQSVFAQDRDGRLTSHIVFLRAQTLEREGDDEAQADQLALNLPQFRLALIDDMVNADENDVSEQDRALLMTGVEMTRTEFDLLLTLVRVFDHARSHFVYEICEPPTKRFLNALRIREEEGGERMPWLAYKNALLERMQNSSTIDGLISFILKPRDNNCPIGLWVAERIAERRLLNEDGIEMSEDTWLELVLAFVSNEEKQTLQVPARDQRAAYDMGAGYDVLTLQRALNRFDPATFRKFQQSHCHDPVAVRVVSLHRLVHADKTKDSPKGGKKPELESHAAGKIPGAAKPGGKINDKFDKKSSLPVKEGKPDQDLYSSFPPKSLRRRLWDAVVAGKCPRCGGPHLRVACPKPRQGWEDDFEKEDFFTKSPPPAKPQLRVQLAKNNNCPAQSILSVQTSVGLCLVDTCSDVSVARRDVLSQTHIVRHGVMVGHLGGETLLQEAGTLELTRALGQSPIALTEVFVVEPDMLPAGVVGLFGVADIAALGVSLDAVMANPGRPWEQSVPLSRFTRIRNSFRRFFGFARAAPAIAVRTDLAIPDHAPLDRRPIVARRGVPRDLPATPRLTEERRGLLDATKQRLSDEQGKRTANRVATLFVEGQARKRALQAAKLAESQRFFQPAADSTRTSSSAEAPRYPPSQTWPRRRQKFYAVRKGRTLGIFDNWEDCERQVKGIASEFKSFSTLEEAKAYLVGRRLNFLLHRCSI